MNTALIIVAAIAVIHGYLRFRHHRHELHARAEKRRTSLKRRVDHGP
jgi:hypothetical protein